MKTLEHSSGPAKAGPAVSCPNCEHSYSGNYCPQCGQKKKNSKVRVRRLFLEFIQELLEFDVRIFRTTKMLFLRPGSLTTEFFLYRRQKYLNPVRLFLATSILYFLFLPRIPVVLGENESESQETVNWEDFDQLRQEQVSGAILVDMKTQHFEERVMSGLPNLFFLMIPVSAMILFMIYIRRKRRLAEHLVFSMHIHSFYFVVSLCMVLLGYLADYIFDSGFLDLAILLAFVIFFTYIFLAMRKFYGQRWMKLISKYLIFQSAYVLAAAVLIANYFAWQFMTEFDLGWTEYFEILMPDAFVFDVE